MKTYEQVVEERTAANVTNFQKEASPNQAQVSGAGRLIEQAEAYPSFTATKGQVTSTDQATLADYIFTVQQVKDLTVVMFAAQVHDRYSEAEETLWKIMEGTLAATRAGQKNADKVAQHAQAALNIYQRWNT